MKILRQFNREIAAACRAIKTTYKDEQRAQGGSVSLSVHSQRQALVRLATLGCVLQAVRRGRRHGAPGSVTVPEPVWAANLLQLVVWDLKYDTGPSRKWWTPELHAIALQLLEGKTEKTPLAAWPTDQRPAPHPAQ